MHVDELVLCVGTRRGFMLYVRMLYMCVKISCLIHRLWSFETDVFRSRRGSGESCAGSG